MSEKVDECAEASYGSQTFDDDNGNCKQCGHPFDPHKIIAYDIEDFSKGGEMRCPVDGCFCFSTISFDFSEKGPT
jgi:hypothetical protein